MTTSRAPGRPGPRSLLVPTLALSLALLTVCGPSVVSGSALVLPGSLAAGSNSTTWAYGALRQVDLSGTATGPLGASYTYSVHATFGFAAVVTETQVAPHTIALNSSRTMGSILSVTFCRPNCVVPLAEGSIDHRAWESLNSSSVLATNGTVLTGDVSVPALALQSSALALNAGVRETTSFVKAGKLQSSLNLTAGLIGYDNLTLHPGLGLIPLNVTPGEAWSSTSGYAQAGHYAWSLSDIVEGLLGVPHAYERSGNGSFSHAGNVTLHGADSGSSVDLGGSSYRAVNLSVSAGPFTLREGWILLPTNADAFGSSSQAWLPNQTGFANSTQASVDVAASLAGGGHLPFGGSGEWWFTRSLNPAASISLGSLAPSVAPTNNATYVQGSPESPAQATAQQSCLSAGTGCPSGSLAPRGLLGLLLIGAAVAVIAVAASVLAIGQRRKLPPPVFPNAGLYPPGGPAAPVTQPAPTTPKPPTPPQQDEDDPLGNLW